MSTCTPYLFTCAARHADTTCCSATVAAAPPDQPGASPSSPVHVYVVPLYVYVTDCPDGSAQNATYRITWSPRAGSSLNHALNSPFVDSPFVDSPFVESPFVD